MGVRAWHLLSLSVVMLCLGLASCKETSETAGASNGKPTDSTETPPPPKATRVAIDTSLGEIIVELDTNRVPVTCDNFLQYVDDKFYDGTIFHRVVENFMIQGGGFTADLQRKSTRPPIKNESRQAGSNVRGTITMARAGAVDSATCQFFINHGDNTRLDTEGGGYTVFGRVVSGLDVVDRIATVPVINRGDPFASIPAETVEIRSIRRK